MTKRKQKSEKLIQKINKKSDQIIKLKKELDVINAKIRKKYKGKFVVAEMKGICHKTTITKRGHKELEKYNKEWRKKVSEYGEDGVQYTPEKTFCLVCGDTNIDETIQYGMFPRFATCPKHNDFLHEGLNIYETK